MDRKKRLSGLLALLLCLCLALSLVPSALAAEPEEPREPGEPETVQPAESAELMEMMELMEEGDPLPTAPYCTWQNAKVVESGEAVSYTLNTWNSDYTAAQVWLAVNLKDNQILQLSFVNVPKSTYAYVYRASVLESQGPKSGNFAARFNPSGAYTGKWQADVAGVYYVMLMPTASGNISDTAAAVTLTALDGDLNEPNNARENATELTENVSTYFTLTGFNDQDWFKITTAEPGAGIKIYLSNFDYTVPTVEANLYTEEGTSAVWSMNFSGNGSGAYKANEAGTYYLKLNNEGKKNGTDRPLRIRFELLPGDERELNDGWGTAFPVPYDYPVEFTLNGDNDVDWFCFETTEDGEIVTLSLTGFETDYSNKIAYNIYNAVYDGLTGEMTGLSSSVYDGSPSITYSRQMSFATPGMHYLRIKVDGRTPVENPLTLILQTYAAPDDQEPNNTWDLATPLFEEEPVTFNLPQGDTDWFRFTADEPNLTMELKLIIPAGGSVDTYLWSGADFASQGNNASYMTYWSSSGNGEKTYRWMLGDAGDYYIRLRPFDNNRAFDDDGSITVRFIPSDEQERNNGWKTAATLNPEVATSFTLPASNDRDWFRIVTTEPNQTLELTLTIPAGGSVDTYLWSGADFASEGDNANYMTYWSSSGSGKKTYRWMLGSAGDYYIRLRPFDSSKIFYNDATISYKLIGPDEYERNNGWATAATLNEGIAVSFTLPAGNDRDWFRIVTEEPNQTVELNLNIPEGGSVSTYLWSGADFASQGDNAGYMTYWSGSGSGKKTYRWMLGSAGDYYVRITPFDSSRFFYNDATVSFRFVAPDANERNNGYTTATELAPRTAVSLTLPAGNDYDWFHIGELTAGDKVTVTWGGLPTKTSVYCYLYYVGEFDTSASSATSFSFSGAGSRTYTIQKDSDYYLRFHLYDSAKWIDAPFWIKYAVTVDDMPVTGIESITNGNRTIFETQTLQLYANVKPANATNQDVTWTSSNEAVATIDANGLVTGLKAGETTITATTVDGGYRMSTVITVTEPISVTGVSIRAEKDSSGKGGSAEDPYPLPLSSPDNPELQVVKVQLTALVEPAGATELGVVWSVSDEKVLAINEYGTVYAIGSGSAQAIAATVDGGYEAKFYINVPDESYPVRGVALSENYRTLYLGEEGFTLTATVSPSYATNPEVIWASSDEAVATVDQAGNVTAVAEGYADITVSAAENGAISAVCSVTVQAPRTRVTGVSIEGASEQKMGLYSTLQLTAVVTPADATDKGVTWTTSDKNIATVSRTGLVTALNLGEVTITAETKDGGHKASVKITVAATAALGDLNNDGAADAGDALLVLRAAVGLIKLSAAQAAVADVNGDGEIDAGDAVLILRYDAGLLDAFPAEG